MQCSIESRRVEKEDEWKSGLKRGREKYIYKYTHAYATSKKESNKIIKVQYFLKINSFCQSTSIYLAFTMCYPLIYMQDTEINRTDKHF